MIMIDSHDNGLSKGNAFQSQYHHSSLPWQGHIHGEHINPEFNLSLLNPRLVRVVQSSRLYVLWHKFAANLVVMVIHESGNIANN